jgi:hypothetical protein
LAKRLAWQQALNDPVADPRNRLPVLRPLQQWQSKRLTSSFADMLADPRMHPAARFFLTDLYGDRRRQIRLIGRVGADLDAAVKKHGVHRLLRASRIPAQLAGLSELQSFLERGFSAFAQLGGAGEFLGRIDRQEREVSRRLFAGEADPFRVS